MGEIPDSGLKGKSCVVTGGAGTLCSVIAGSLSASGVRVVILDHDLGNAQTIAQNIALKTGTECLGVEGDVLDRNSLINAKVLINEKFGPINYLVNGAGGNSPKATTRAPFIDASNLKNLEDTFFGLDLDGFREVFDLNFLGTVLPTMIFAGDMLKEGKGAIVNISSMNSFRPLLRIPAYSAAKASINNFTQWMAVHLSKTGIRVNSIAPGFFLTRQNRFLLVKESDNDLTERGRKVLENTPMGRFGVPQDLAGSVIFLLSDYSGFITGVTLPVDGGFNAFSGL
jgi:NAD(P)-dependent dehydrogenase (short-subunit alcohol dehydrogenase family)